VLGYLANIVRERKNGNVAYWVRNQHINYTECVQQGLPVLLVLRAALRTTRAPTP
jgi:hypothetical protein